MDSDFLTLYGAKIVEYLLALGYLAAFVFFWRWVSGGPAPARSRDETSEKRRPS